MVSWAWVSMTFMRRQGNHGCFSRSTAPETWGWLECNLRSMRPETGSAVTLEADCVQGRKRRLVGVAGRRFHGVRHGLQGVRQCEIGGGLVSLLSGFSCRASGVGGVMIQSSIGRGRLSGGRKNRQLKRRRDTSCGCGVTGARYWDMDLGGKGEEPRTSAQSPAKIETTGGSHLDR